MQFFFISREFLLLINNLKIKEAKYYLLWLKGFKKLTSLKLVTCIRDAKDYLNDPWVLIMRLLT